MKYLVNPSAWSRKCVPSTTIALQVFYLLAHISTPIPFDTLHVVSPTTLLHVLRDIHIKCVQEVGLQIILSKYPYGNYSLLMIVSSKIFFQISYDLTVKLQFAPKALENVSEFFIYMTSAESFLPSRLSSLISDPPVSFKKLKHEFHV